MSLVSGSNDTALTVALIGAGQVGEWQGQAFVQLSPDVRIVGVADIDERRANELAATCGARAYADYHVLLEELTPDIAVICLPHHLHLEAGQAAAAVGSHILMEKPLAHTLEDAHAILDTCQQHKVLLTVSFVHRYRIEFKRAYELISSNQIGVPAISIDTFTFPGGTHVPGWVWQKHQAGGGILMYTGIHSIDRLRWLLDSEVEEVFARAVTYSQEGEVEDGLLATLMFANGCVASLIENQPSYLASANIWNTEIYGSKAHLRIKTGQCLEFTNDFQTYRLEVTRDDRFVAQAREFVAAVREKREPWITGEDGLRALEVAMALYRSAELGRAVSVKESLE
jgi:predicted dehydrogenase